MKKHVPLGKKNTVEVGRSCGVQRCAQLGELTASSRERFVVVVDWNPFGYVTPKGVLTGRVRAFAPQSTPPAACVSGRGPRLPLPRVLAAGCGCRRCAPGVCVWAHRCALTGWVGVTWVGGWVVGAVGSPCLLFGAAPLAGGFPAATFVLWLSTISCCHASGCGRRPNPQEPSFLSDGAVLRTWACCWSCLGCDAPMLCRFLTSLFEWATLSLPLFLVRSAAAPWRFVRRATRQCSLCVTAARDWDAVFDGGRRSRLVCHPWPPGCPRVCPRCQCVEG